MNYSIESKTQDTRDKQITIPKLQNGWDLRFDYCLCLVSRVFLLYRYLKICYNIYNFYFY